MPEEKDKMDEAVEFEVVEIFPGVFSGNWTETFTQDGKNITISHSPKEKMEIEMFENVTESESLNSDPILED